MVNLAILEARNVQIALRVDGTPGLGITPSDIAHALGQIRKHDYPSLLLRTKYLLDEESGRVLLRRLKGYILITSAINGWGMSNRDGKVMAEILMREYISPTLCMSCNGNKGLMIGDKWHGCRSCKQTGIHQRTDASMARNLEIDLRAWLDTVEERFNLMMSKLSAWETEGLMWVSTVR